MREAEVSRLFRPVHTLAGLSVPQTVVVSFAAWWLAFSLIDEIAQAASHFPPGKPGIIIFYAFPIALNFIVIGFPLLLFLLFYRRSDCSANFAGERLPIHRVVVLELRGVGGILLFYIILLSPAYGIIDLFFYPFSVMPLITPVCSLLGVLIGHCILRYMEPRRRLTILALSMCVISAARYCDWHPLILLRQIDVERCVTQPR